MTADRISATFAACAQKGRAAFVGYLMAADPDIETSYQNLVALSAAGADIIELGAPFTDPMADGVAIQKAALRSLAAGGSLAVTLEIARRFRIINQTTPLIVMGYANPIHRMGYAAFARAAAEAGVDGVITVDLPPEEDAPLRTELAAHGLAVIRLATPTTTEKRMETVANGSSGFVYYVSVAGVTGAGVGSGCTKRSRASMAAGGRPAISVGAEVVSGWGMCMASCLRLAAASSFSINWNTGLEGAWRPFSKTVT